MAVQTTDAPNNVHWLTLGKACRLLGVDESTLRRWADSGHVHAFRTPGGHRRFAEADIQGLLSARERQGESYQALTDMTVSRVRRQLHRKPAQEAHWYAAVDESIRSRLRPLGRQLATLAADYLQHRRRRAAMLDDARALGREYGRELASSNMPLAQAVEAFVFFRRSLDDSTKQASQRNNLSANDAMLACEQVNTLADQVLIGMTEVYEPAARPFQGRARRTRTKRTKERSGA